MNKRRGVKRTREDEPTQQQPPHNVVLPKDVIRIILSNLTLGDLKCVRLANKVMFELSAPFIAERGRFYVHNDFVMKHKDKIRAVILESAYDVQWLKEIGIWDHIVDFKTAWYFNELITVPPNCKIAHFGSHYSRPIVVRHSKVELLVIERETYPWNVSCNRNCMRKLIIGDSRKELLQTRTYGNLAVYYYNYLPMSLNIVAPE